MENLFTKPRSKSAIHKIISLGFSLLTMLMLLFSGYNTCGQTVYYNGKKIKNFNSYFHKQTKCYNNNNNNNN